MGWLSRLLDLLALRRQRGISLGLLPAWEISPPRDAANFIRALAQLLPPGSIIYLEGTGTAPDVRDFLRPRQADPAQKITRGTIWPRPECFHIAAIPENIDGLASLFDRHAFPEICHHFHAYAAAGIIVEWYDCFGKDPLYVSRDVPVERIEAFCELTGSTYSEVANRT